MKHINKKILVAGILILGVCLFRFYSSNRNHISLESLSGVILLEGPITEEENSLYDLVLFDPVSSAITHTDVYGESAIFMGKRSIILENIIGEMSLHNLETKETNFVYQSEETDISCIAYVDENHFSIVEKNNLVLVDMETGEREVLVKGIGNDIHSWSPDGKTVYFSVCPEGENQQIFMLNVETSQKEYLFDGWSPKISNDGKLIAYCPDDSFSRLVVKELNGDDQWEYRAPIEVFCFSPNGNHLATIERGQGSGTGLYLCCTVRVVDYKTGKRETVIPKNGSGNYSIIDWSE